MAEFSKLTYGSDTWYIRDRNYCVCEDEADVVAKEAALDGFELVEGAKIVCRFVEYNSAANATLNVNETGDIPIVMNGDTPIGTSASTSWASGSIIALVYDGTNWVMEGNTSHYSVATTTSDGLMSSADKTKLDGLVNYSVATQSANGLMSSTDKTKLDNLYNIDTTFTNRYLRVNNTSTKNGLSQLWLGNATASTENGSSSGGLVMYGSGAYYAYLVPGNQTANHTITLPDKTGTVALTGAEKFAGDITTDSAAGTTSAWDYTYFIGGNNKSGKVANKSVGALRLYGYQSYYHDVWAVDTMTANRQLRLPDASGTVALTSDIKTYTASTGIAISSANAISNSGVRSIATGGTNGTISVNTNGTSANVAVKGLGTAAYTASTAYAAASHTHSYIPTSGGTSTGNLTVNLSNGTTSAIGWSYFIAGNSTAKGTAKNSAGCLRLYSPQTYYCNLSPVDGYSANREIRLPNAAGTLGVLVTTTKTISTNGTTLRTGLYTDKHQYPIGLSLPAKPSSGGTYFHFVVDTTYKGTSAYGEWLIVGWPGSQAIYATQTFTIYYLQF